MGTREMKDYVKGGVGRGETGRRWRWGKRSRRDREEEGGGREGMRGEERLHYNYGRDEIVSARIIHQWIIDSSAPLFVRYTSHQPFTPGDLATHEI